MQKFMTRLGIGAIIVALLVAILFGFFIRMETVQGHEVAIKETFSGVK